MSALNLLPNVAPPSISTNDVETLRQLDTEDNRTAMYLHYFELGGPDIALTQAKVSSFSGFPGAVADAANQRIKFLASPLYPQGGVIKFSKDISKNVVDGIETDVLNGGKGIFTDTQMLEMDHNVWKQKGLGDLFPGNAFRWIDFLGRSDASFSTKDFNGVLMAIGGGISEVATTGKVYGYARQHFKESADYQWYYKKVNGKDISCALDRRTGKVVFVEESKYAKKLNGAIKIEDDRRLIDVFKEAVIPFAPPLPPRPNAAKNVQSQTGNAPPRGSAEEERDYALFLRSNGLRASDVTPEAKAVIVEMANRYAAEQSAANSFPFEFFEEAANKLVIIAQVTGKPKLMFAAQLGQRGLNVVRLVSELPGALMSAPTFFAAFNPIMALGMAIFSFSSLFSKRQEQNQLQPLMEQLTQISQQIRAMHQDMIEGINCLLIGQENLLNTMIERFDRLENLIRNEHERLGGALLLNMDRIENFLALIHNDLCFQIREVYVQPFDRLEVRLLRAISTDNTADEQRNFLRSFQGEIFEFEDWLISKSGSAMLNGYRYIRFLEEHQITNPVAEKLVNSRLVNENVQLEFMVGYLGQIAQDILGADQFTGNAPDKLCNPTFWIKGVTTYLSLRHAMSTLGIPHDRNSTQLNRSKRRVRIMQILSRF